MIPEISFLNFVHRPLTNCCPILFQRTTQETSWNVSGSQELSLFKCIIERECCTKSCQERMSILLPLLFYTCGKLPARQSTIFVIISVRVFLKVKYNIPSFVSSGKQEKFLNKIKGNSLLSFAKPILSNCISPFRFCPSYSTLHVFSVLFRHDLTKLTAGVCLEWSAVC